MKFTALPLAGAFLLQPYPSVDTRGTFLRTFDANEFAGQGLVTDFGQCSLSYNRRQGTIRGLHWQVSPALETKLVRCVHGAIYDVIVDLRPESPTYLASFGVELSAATGLALYLPPLCAHGFQVLVDDSTVYYHICGAYTPTAARGARFDDPRLRIRWPLPVTVLSERDRAWPLLDAGIPLPVGG